MQNTALYAFNFVCGDILYYAPINSISLVQKYGRRLILKAALQEKFCVRVLGTSLTRVAKIDVLNCLESKMIKKRTFINHCLKKGKMWYPFRFSLNAKQVVLSRLNTVYHNIWGEQVVASIF